MRRHCCGCPYLGVQMDVRCGSIELRGCLVGTFEVLAVRWQVWSCSRSCLAILSALGRSSVVWWGRSSIRPSWHVMRPPSWGGRDSSAPHLHGSTLLRHPRGRYHPGYGPPNSSWPVLQTFPGRAGWALLWSSRCTRLCAGFGNHYWGGLRSLITAIARPTVIGARACGVRDV